MPYRSRYNLWYPGSTTSVSSCGVGDCQPVSPSSFGTSVPVVGITWMPDNCQSCRCENPFTCDSLLRYPVPHTELVLVSGRSLTIPNGLLADWKKKYRATSASTHGFTRPT